MRSWLADLNAGQHPDVAGLPLPRTAPTADDLRRGVGILEQKLRSADYDHIVFCVAKLISGFNERLTKDEAKARARLWQEVIPDVPRDLWSAGVIELLQTWKRDDHYGRVPEAADLLACIQDTLTKRATDLQRCKEGLAQANGPDPAKAPGPIRVPATVRLKRIIEEQRVDPNVSDEDRLFNMANTERALALQERRLMAPWAEKFFEDRVKPDRDSLGHQAKTVVDRSTPTNRRLAELAAAKREGRPVAEDRDVPEGAAP